MQKTEVNNPPTPAPLWRHLLAMLYDALLVAATLMLATLPVVTIWDGVPGGWARHVFQLYLLLIIFLFYGWFWVNGGQTLGMRSWRLQLIGRVGNVVTWKMALLRIVAAILSGLVLGLGYAWVLVDKNGFTWHDYVSNSRMILLPKK